MSICSIPLEKIATVRRELRTTHRRTEGQLDLAIGSQTTITLELTEPVAHFTFSAADGTSDSSASTPTTPTPSYARYGPSRGSEPHPTPPPVQPA